MRSPILPLVAGLFLAMFALPLAAQTTVKKPSMAAAAKPRAPRPSVQAQRRELHRLRTLHAAEYAAATREARHALARRLLAEGHLLREANAERYVLWRESAHMAILSGDINLAWATIMEIEKLYAISAFELKAAALEAAAAKKEPLAEPAKFAQAAFLAFEDAKLFDPESAGRLLTFAKTSAAQANDVTLVTLVDARMKDFEHTRRDLDEGKKAIEALKTTPDDPVLNLKAGSFLCFARGDWAAGLPMLARGSDNELASLARSDIERPTEAAARVLLADAWFSQSKAMTGVLKMHVLARSCAWYREAIPGLTGFTKTRVEAKLTELESIPNVPLALASIPEPATPTVPSPIEVKAIPSTPASPLKDGAWMVLFRSADPAIWNQAVRKGPDDFAVPIADVPQDIRYLKLTNAATKEFVIIEMSRAALKSRAKEGRYRWNGSAQMWDNASHLGIVDTARAAYSKEFAGQIAVDMIKSKGAAAAFGRPGWGFGSRSFMEDVQGFAWGRDKALSQTVFEIAVGKGPLTPVEAAGFLSDNLNKLAEVNGIAPYEDNGEWKSIFRSSDPKDWGFADRRGAGFAIDLRKVPDGIRYLKMSNMTSSSFVIVQVTKQGLLSIDNESRHGWHGAAALQNGAVHLGIANRAAPATKGVSSIGVGPAEDCRSGWGFGHPAENGGQGYVWNGSEVPATVFDISVKSGALTSAESAKLLPAGR